MPENKVKYCCLYLTSISLSTVGEILLRVLLAWWEHKHKWKSLTCLRLFRQDESFHWLRQFIPTTPNHQTFFLKRHVRPRLIKQRLRNGSSFNSDCAINQCRSPQLRLVIKTRQQKQKKNYSTQYSRVVSHRSTNLAIACLTSGIGRDRVLSYMCGRSWQCGWVVIFINLGMEIQRGTSCACSKWATRVPPSPWG